MTSGPEPTAGSERGTGSDQAAPAPRRSRSLLWTVALLLLAAAGALWGSSALGWLSRAYRTPFTGVRVIELSGAQVRAELVPLALAALAAVAAVLATGGVLRRVVGVLVELGGGVLAWRAIAWSTTGITPDVSDQLPAGSVALGGFDSGITGVLLMSLGALLLLTAGVLVALLAKRMPAMGAKYSAPGAAQRQARVDPDKHLWESLDSGLDPTDEEHGSVTRGDDAEAERGDPAENDDSANGESGPR